MARKDLVPIRHLGGSQCEKHYDNSSATKAHSTKGWDPYVWYHT